MASVIFDIIIYASYFLQKLKSRNSVVMTSSTMSDTQKYALKIVMLRSFMSSEESGKHCIDGEVAKSVLLVKSLPWRAAKLGRIVKQLDKRLLKK